MVEKEHEKRVGLLQVSPKRDSDSDCRMIAALEQVEELLNDVVEGLRDLVVELRIANGHPDYDDGEPKDDTDEIVDIRGRR